MKCEDCGLVGEGAVEKISGKVRCSVCACALGLYDPTPPITVRDERPTDPAPPLEAPRGKPTNPKDRAATNRLDLTLFPDSAAAYGALAFTEGDAKYGGYNWRVAGVQASVYVAACGRHLRKWFHGQDDDPQTGVPHLANALACIAVIIDSVEQGNLKDDRPPKQDHASLLARFEKIVAALHATYPNGPARHRAVK